MDSAIEVSDLTVYYCDKNVLERLSFRVGRGELFGFLGPNGAGKSSTIKALLGLLLPQSGRITVDGLPASDPRSRRKVGFMPEEATYYRFLTPVEILRFYGEVFGIPGGELKKR